MNGLGSIASISGDAVEQPGSTAQPPRLIYTARINLEKDVMNVDGKDAQLSPGMVAAVEIKIGTRKLIEYIFSSLRRVRRIYPGTLVTRKTSRCLNWLNHQFQ